MYPSSEAPSQPTLSDLRSTGNLTSQRSNTQATPSQRSHRRGDVLGSRALDSFLQSQNSDIHAGNNGPGSQSLGAPVGGLLGTLSSTTHLTSDPTAVKRVIWGTSVDVNESMAMFKDFISNFTKAHRIRFDRSANAMEDNLDDADMRADDDAQEAESAEENNKPFYDHYLAELLTHSMMEMNLDCTNLKSFEPSRKLYHQLVRYPQEIIPLLDHTLTEIVLDKFPDSHFTENDMMKVRPFNLGRNVNLRELDPSDIDQLVTVKGLLIRASPIIPDLKTAFFRCSVCEQTITVENDRGRIREPTVCPREACKGKNTMRLIHNRCEFSNKQVYRLQETPDEIPDGQTPYTVSMCVYDDLVDVAKPGDRVEVTGIYRGVPVRENTRRRAIKSLFKTYVDIVHIKRVDKKRIGIDSSIRNQNEAVMDFIEDDKIEQDDPEEEKKIVEISKREDLYELLARSIAPSIFGLDDVKKGVLLQLFGGANKFNKNKPGAPRIRGEINVLLVGDPGVSKSQLLQYVHKLAPRGVYTSGKGSSAVGLTAYVTRDPDTRQLVLERYSFIFYRRSTFLMIY